MNTQQCAKSGNIAESGTKVSEMTFEDRRHERRTRAFMISLALLTVSAVLIILAVTGHSDLAERVLESAAIVAGAIGAYLTWSKRRNE